MRIQLKEEDRVKLSELYLRRQLILQDIERLQRLAQDISLQIQSEQLRVTKEQFKDPKEDQIRPLFQDYRLVGLEVPDNWEKMKEE